MEKQSPTPAEPLNKAEPKQKTDGRLGQILVWGATLVFVGILLSILFRFNPLENLRGQEEAPVVQQETSVNLPVLTNKRVDYSLVRNVHLDTTIPEGTRHFPVKYTVEQGDSIFAIAKKFSITPESILWANYDLLNDDPTYLNPGWQLTIPPTNGIYYKWKEGDTLEKVAEKYYASVTDIISWPSNHMDITNPSTDGLEYVMIPGGYRELTPWIVPIAFSPRSGATRVIAGPGGCSAPAGGPMGSTAFVWPAVNFSLSGFDFSSYHLAIDIAAGVGDPIYASDNGTVIYAGWNDTGYGNLIVIDHNNGYETVYAHLSALYVSCGDSVYRGTVIGAAGNTGKSTGSHLHFEVRLNGGFVNPWSLFGY